MIVLQAVEKMIKASRVYRNVRPEICAHMESQVTNHNEQVRRARALKFEALVAYAQNMKLKESAKRLVRGEMGYLASNQFPENYVHPVLLEAAKKILD